MGKKITTDKILITAIDLINQRGVDQLTLKEVAATLGIKPPSLYNHFANLEALIDSIALKSMTELYDLLVTDMIGLAGVEALEKIAFTYRNYARTHPGQYEAIQRVSLWKSTKTIELSEKLVRLFEKIVQNYLPFETEQIHYIRTFRSYLHGFILLELDGSFGMEQDIEESFKYGVNQLLKSLQIKTPEKIRK
ncbi:TetR/AcrR family transcriptional regulator [Enterococcus songbeiensis]|uniref:TetR/AcrR family transcriptional regulator n=1 Tax=Enterococcus songbeiensis TaxID=2559927 RepID=UPI00148539E2|nr:TetR/AcrR family transcriptional regulator [Enterococcus songbeiensis]